MNLALLQNTAVSHSLAKGGEADMGKIGIAILRFIVCLVFVTYILTIKAC